MWIVARTDQQDFEAVPAASRRRIRGLRTPGAAHAVGSWFPVCISARDYDRRYHSTRNYL
jgi:hypothetical protein